MAKSFQHNPNQKAGLLRSGCTISDLIKPRFVKFAPSLTALFIQMNKLAVRTILFLLLVQPLGAISQQAEQEYDEIAVYMRIQGVGAFEINGYYSYESNRLYLPVVELFQFLKINQTASADYGEIKGFLIDEQRTYSIDHTKRTISIDGKTLALQAADLLKTETGLYLNSGVYGPAFGLYCTFHFRSLSVELKTDLELPAIREMRLQQMRQNFEHLRGKVTADTTLGRRYHFFRFGMVDWALSATQQTDNLADNRAQLGMGGELLGGETNLFLNYSSREGFDGRNQHYQWRWANNQSSLLRQVRAGKIGTISIASIYDPFVGVSLTNAPTTYRRSFGSYTLSNFTEPGWTVELYINNVLVDYQTADASGFYSFNAPLVYGASQVMLKFYGPYGEERTREQNINIPFNFLPKGELEYTVSGGVIQSADQSFYSRAEAKYGINRFITLGGGMEYLSSIASRPEIPFLSAAITPFNNFMISGEYAHGVRTKALLSYRLPSNLMFDFDYTFYEKGQQAIRFNYLEERKATLAIPVQLKWMRGFARFSYRQNIYEMLTYNTADMTFSTNFGPVNANLMGYASWIDRKTPYVYGNLAMGLRLGKGFTIRPQTQFDVSNREVVSFKTEVEKKIQRLGFFSISYENNIRMAYQSVDFSFRWDLRYSQTNLALRLSKNSVTSTQGARGSLAFGSGNNYIHIDNRSAVGRGGITIIPFLDINHNRVRDKEEPIVSGLRVKINGGRMLRERSDSINRVIEMEPYACYLLELDESGLENISWQIKNKAISVYIDPNQFKKIEIPVFPMGEANGRVYLQDSKGLKGLGRIVVNFYRSDGSLFRKVLSESDGFVTFLGLEPGDYYAKIDSDQLKRLKMISIPESILFTIQPMENGDIADGLDFILKPAPSEEGLPIEKTSGQDN